MQLAITGSKVLWPKHFLPIHRAWGADQMRREGVWIAYVTLLAIAGYMLWGGPEASPIFQIPEESADPLARAPLVANLPSDASAANREFVERISNRFPVGTPEADLIAALSAQGFKRTGGDVAVAPRDGQSVAPPPFMVRQRRKGQCIYSWIVGWDTDEEQRIATLHAGYESGCY
jgi:hypothetical protein